MKGKLSLIALLAIAAPVLAPATAHAGCTPYESCLFAGCTLQLLKDDSFESNCSSAWSYTGNASRDYSSHCGFRYTGPFNTWTGELDTYGTSAIYQNVFINDPQGYRTRLSLDVDLKTVGTANPYDRLTITIRNLSNQVLETVGTINPDPSRYDCRPVHFEIQGFYYGQTVRVYLEATNSQLGTSFIVDGVRLWLST